MSGDSRSAQASWKAVNDLFHRALDRPATERSRWLDAECAGDTALRDEVASLLAAHDRAATFLERPAGDVSTLSQPEPVPPLVGQTLGQYRVVNVLGEGGMGVVYLAEDTRLGRTVALKALAPQFTLDERRRERLRREARTAAALTHPGIATIYALEEIGDELYIASEYVPGETVREELSRGPLPVARVLETGLAIAHALSAAHDRGIIHRDLKPENVIRTPRGQIKILDFGLAQFRSAPQPLSHLTDEGVMLGTPAYMSPEQIRGEPVDARADLFSFGVMLYELTSGVSPFAGSSVTSTIAKILEARPPRLTGLNPGSAAPTGLAALDDIVDVCLRKRPDDRFESTHQLVAALEGAAGGNEQPAQSPPASAPSWWWQFHQAATSLGYLAMLIPLSFVRQSESDTFGLILFLAGLVSALVASTLRLHVWFTFRSYPAEWSRQRQRTRWWIRTADVAFVVVQIAAAAVLLTSHPRLTMLFVAAAVAEFLAFAVIEPATTRAAFKR